MIHRKWCTYYTWRVLCLTKLLTCLLSYLKQLDFWNLVILKSGFTKSIKTKIFYLIIIIIPKIHPFYTELFCNGKFCLFSCWCFVYLKFFFAGHNITNTITFQNLHIFIYFYMFYKARQLLLDFSMSPTS